MEEQRYCEQMINISSFYYLGNHGGGSWPSVDLFFCAHAGTHRFTTQC